MAMSLLVIGTIVGILSLTVAAIQLYIGFPKISVAKRSEFYCALSPNPAEGGEDWAVMYRNGRGHTKVWLRMVRSMGGGFDPQRRCDEVAQRLNIYKEDGLISFDYRPDPDTPNRAYLAVGGGARGCPRNRGEEVIKAVIGPGQSEEEKMVEAILAPAHANALETLLNEPFTGAFHHSRA